MFIIDPLNSILKLVKALFSIILGFKPCFNLPSTSLLPPFAFLRKTGSPEKVCYKFLCC